MHASKSFSIEKTSNKNYICAKRTENGSLNKCIHKKFLLVFIHPCALHSIHSLTENYDDVCDDHNNNNDDGNGGAACVYKKS